MAAPDSRWPASPTVLFRELADVLQRSSTVNSPSSRNLLFQQLDRALGTPLPAHEGGTLRTRLVEVATQCAARPRGLHVLADCLDLFEPDNGESPLIRRAADEWTTAEQFAGRHDLGWLHDELSRRPVTAELRHFVVELRGTTVPPYCESAWHLFAFLATLHPIGGVPPCLHLVQWLMAGFPEPGRARLLAVSQAMAAEWGVTDRIEPAAPVRHAEELMAYLVIQFEKYGGDDETFIVSHWHQWASPAWEPIHGEDRHVRRDDLETAVDDIIMETERQWASRDGTVVIEFVLPWQLLNEPVDRWHFELSSRTPSRLTAVYPVVVRSLERIRAEYWHRRWRSRWSAVGDPTAGTEHIFCAIEGHADVQLEAALARRRRAVVLVLSGPPTPGSTGERQLEIGLRAGMPAIVWHRNSVPSEPLCELIASMYDIPLPGGVASLPTRVAQLRQAAWDGDPLMKDEHVGHGLVLLWDDPSRLPAPRNGRKVPR